MSVQPLEYAIINALILKDRSSAHVWKDMSLNPHEPVDRKVNGSCLNYDWHCRKIVISMDCLLLQEVRNLGYY